MSAESNINKEEHIRSLYSSLSQSSQQFERQCMYISSGAFTLSFAFITDIIPDLQKAHFKWLLISAWVVFLGVIFISLIGHFISTAYHVWAVKNAALSPEDFNKKIRPWNYVIQGLNIISILGLGTGCVQLVWFISLNL